FPYFLFSQTALSPSFNLNYSLSIAQSANDDWKSGKNINLEVSYSMEPSFIMYFGNLQFFTKIKYAIGVGCEYFPDTIIL
ncbi:MAG TPA: hypothetical protein DCW42_08245, partial [Bacteroidetes bacterium]|nr:hypothetical protein [Bacteroidota bacterium]